MAIKKLTLTEDHIKLIGALQLSKFSFSDSLNTTKLDNAIEDIEDEKDRIEALEKKNGASGKRLDDNMAPFQVVIESLNIAKDKIRDISMEKSHFAYGVDLWSLWGGSYVLEDIARILGRYDERIPNSEDYATGPQFEPDFENYMYDLYDFMVTNMDYILSLVFQFSTKGGITAGTYKCINYQMIWEKVENNK